MIRHLMQHPGLVPPVPISPFPLGLPLRPPPLHRATQGLPDIPSATGYPPVHPSKPQPSPHSSTRSLQGPSSQHPPTQSPAVWTISLLTRGPLPAHPGHESRFLQAPLIPWLRLTLLNP